MIHLSVHVENGERVYFNSENLKKKVQNPPKTTLTRFFKLCDKDAFARSLYYFEIPSYYTWNGKQWTRRKKGISVKCFPDIKRDAAIGRVFTVHPNNSEYFYLRVLLHNVRGPISFNNLRTVNGILHETSRAACNALGLLQNDQHWDDCLSESAVCRSPLQLKDLFVVLLINCEIADPKKLWDKYKDDLSEDYRKKSLKLYPKRPDVPSDEIYNEALKEIRNKIKTLSNKSLSDFDLPPISSVVDIENKELFREMSYNISDLNDYVNTHEPL